MHYNKKILGLLLMASTSMAISTANATDAEVLNELKALKERITYLEQKLEKTQISEKKSSPSKAVSSPQDLILKLSPAPSISTADKSTSFAVDGRILADAGFVSGDGSSADFANATDFRAVRAGVKGKIMTDWMYRFIIDFANNSTSIKDVFLSYTGLKTFSIAAGHFKEFNGIEALSSSLHTTFMERSSAVTTFRTGRNLGISGKYYSDNLGIQLGIFGESPDDNGSDDEGYGFSGRIFGQAINTENELLHLGASIRYRTPDSASDSVRFRSRGESHVIGERLVDTGTINGVDNHISYAAELRYQNGPASIMGEYYITDVSREAESDLTFNSGYIALSYFLTGDQRSYKKSSGKYGGVSPKSPFSLSEGGKGAWEIAGRYTFLDLNDGTVNGGELDAWTLGVNWYPNKNVKFMLNYVINELDDNAIYPDEDPHYIMLRSQVSF